MGETHEAPLPDGWEKIEHNGKALYLNHKLKKTQWHDPREAPKEVPEPKLDMFDPLPSHWKQILHMGRICFLNSRTKTSHWEDPRLTSGNGAGGSKHGGNINHTQYEAKINRFRSSLPTVQASNQQITSLPFCKMVPKPTI